MKQQQKNFVQWLAYNYLSLKNVYYPMISTRKWNRELSYYTGRLFGSIFTPTIFQAILKKAMTSNSNACTCSRFCPLVHFIVYRLSSSLQPTADFHQTSCGEASQEDVSSELGWHQHTLGLRCLWLLCTSDIWTSRNWNYWCFCLEQ